MFSIQASRSRQRSERRTWNLEPQITRINTDQPAPTEPLAIETNCENSRLPSRSKPSMVSPSSKSFPSACFRLISQKETALTETSTVAAAHLAIYLSSCQVVKKSVSWFGVHSSEFGDRGSMLPTATGEHLGLTQRTRRNAEEEVARSFYQR
jgi:cytoskeletal protein RodZ